MAVNVVDIGWCARLLVSGLDSRQDRIPSTRCLRPAVGCNRDFRFCPASCLVLWAARRCRSIAAIIVRVSIEVAHSAPSEADCRVVHCAHSLKSSAGSSCAILVALFAASNAVE